MQTRSRMENTVLRKQSKRVWAFLGLGAGLPLLLIGLYLVNPFGAHGWDIRERVVGHSTYRVSSRSMAPTLTSGDIVVSRAGHYRRHAPVRGDVVLFEPSQGGAPWMSRVVGLPGETIAIVDGIVQVDGVPLLEPYVDPANRTRDYSLHMRPITVADRQVLLLGDNRDNSDDGRFSGTVGIEALTGRILGVE